MVLNQYEPIRDQVHVALQPSTSPPTQKAAIRTRVVQMPANNFNNHIQHSVQVTNQISNHRNSTNHNSNRYHEPQPQMNSPQNGSGTSFEPILYKIIRQKSTGTNSGVFFYFKIYDKIYRGRRDSFSKDKTIMYLRCNTCPRSVNKVSYSHLFLTNFIVLLITGTLKLGHSNRVILNRTNLNWTNLNWTTLNWTTLNWTTLN